MEQSSTFKRVEMLVIQPDVLDPLDRFVEWLEHDRIDIKLVRPFLGETVPQFLDSAGLIVLGGSMNAYDDEVFPWLEDIRNLLRQAVESETPTLGICLGAQLLATSFDGKVTVNAPAGPEVGVINIKWTKDAESDDLFGGFKEPFLAGAFHHDGITRLPSESVRLGTGVKYPNQVFRIGSAWGVQFHPEVSPDQFKRWLEVARRDDFGTDECFAEEVEEFRRLDPSVSQHQERLAQRFAQTVVDRALVRK